MTQLNYTTVNYITPEYVNALVEALLCEIERIYQNNNQTEWRRDEDPHLKGVEFRPYYWISEEKIKPNLKFKGLKQEIRWYKYPHRGQTCTIKMNEKEWVYWFNQALKIIRNGEK